MITVSIKNATLKLKNREVLSNIDIDLFEGEQLTVLGGHEADLLLAMIAGIIPPSSGTIQIFGNDALKYRQHLSSLVSYLPPDPYIPPTLKLREYLELSCTVRRVKKAEQKELVSSILESLGLKKISQYRLGQLSESEKRMAALASILVTRSRLLLLTRPFENLSFDYRELVAEHLKKSTKSGVTCILTSNTFDHLTETDKVAIIKNGKLVAQGILKDLVKIMLDEQYLVLRVMDTKAVMEKLSKFPTIKKIGISRDGVIKIWLKDFSNDASPTIELLFSLNLGVKQISIKQLSTVEACKQMYRKIIQEET
jgi:ABC-2 type transport system ATP-binding protein